MKIIGHRGAAGLAPQNTVAGLHKALEHHVDMLEFDLRVTADNVVILHHDAELTDPNGNKHAISATDYAVLKDHKNDLATFDGVLETFGGKVPLYVEVKPGEPIEPIVKLIKANPKKSDLLLASKSLKTLLDLHEALPELQTIVIEPWSGVRGHYRARKVNAKIVAMNQHWLWWGFIRGFKNSDVQLFAYTLNDPKKAARWAKYGLSGVITDYPDRFEK